jgi:predicted component of type VI protein secretion system
MAAKEPQRTPYLVVRLGDQPEWAVLWNTIEITVGRLDSQDIVVPDAEVSRRHAVFRRQGLRFEVEDLNTGLGTLVNGAPIKSHELQHGDVIQIGMLTLRFGQTTREARPGANVRFASHLKGGGAPLEPDDAAGRTMMAFDVDDELFPPSPSEAPEPPQARAVTADGALEELEHPDLLGPGGDLGLEGAVRDLDAEFTSDPQALPGAGREASRPGALPTRPSLAPLREGPTAPGEVRAMVVLEVAGPAAQVEAVLRALRGSHIQAPPLRFHVHDSTATASSPPQGADSGSAEDTHGSRSG